MARLVTIANLVDRCKQRADKEFDDQISSAEWKSLLSEVYAELYGEVALVGYRHFETSTTVTATGATSYTQPADFQATVVLCRVLDTGRLLPLVELGPGEERAFYSQTGNATGYQLIDDQLYLYPNPSSGTYKWRYVAQAPDLTTYSDSDTVDVITPDGETFLMWGTVVLALSKSESDVRFAMDRMERARERLQVWAANRSLEGRRRVDGVELDDVVGGRPEDWLA